MKTKQTLIALTATLSLFCAGQAWSQSSNDTHMNALRIDSITKGLVSNSTQTPATAGTQIYFDVTFTDTFATTSQRWSITGSNLIGTEISAGGRPYLQLNVPLRGTSSKVGTSLVANEPASEVTDTAVAYYVGAGTTATGSLRFVYTVRPGDMVDDITWIADGDGNPAFGGKVSAIELTTQTSGAGSTTQVNLSNAALQAKDGGITTNDDLTLPVFGYTLSIGDVGTGDYNVNQLYQGLVPVTLTTEGDAAASTFANATSCYLWVEKLDNGAWKQVPAGVTLMRSANTQIKEGTYNGPLQTSFAEGYAARADVPNAATYTAQTFFVNIPVSTALAAGDTVRLCYGVPSTNTANAHVYGYYQTKLLASPAQTRPGIGSYSLASSESVVEGFTLPDASQLSGAYASLAGKTISATNGVTINAAAGEQVLVQIAKDNISAYGDYGTLYAAIEQISASSKCSFSQYYIPLDPSKGDYYSLNLNINANVNTDTETYYRVVIPQLEDPAADTFAIDEPLYIRVKASPKRETITIEAVGDTYGTEYYTPLPAYEDGEIPTGASTVLQYTLSVENVEPTRRYFTIYPVASDGVTRIPSTATYSDASHDPGTRVHDVIRHYATLQAQGGQPLASAGAELTVTLPANQTSVNFYVAMVNDFPSNYLSGQFQVDGRTYTVPMTPTFVAKASDIQGNITGTNDECITVCAPQVNDRAPSITATNPPNSGSVNTALHFTFGVADVASDYLIVTINYGDGSSDTKLYVDQPTMRQIMGTDTWEARLQTLINRYGLKEDEDIFERSPNGAETVDFEHTYTDGREISWNLSVIDSASAQTNTSGTFTLTTSQTFTFYTYLDSAAPAAGYVVWGAADGDAGEDGWSFGYNYTYNALPKTGGSSTVTVRAIPFAAGDGTPANYVGVSTTKDSFFYKWGATSQAYAGLLPEGNYLYASTVTINRAFVSGGGEAQSFEDWEDIILEAQFAAEYLPGDAETAYTTNAAVPYLRNLGDRNQDGVPDGWLLSALGEGDEARGLMEGRSQANTAVEGDNIVNAGWGSGDTAYALTNANRNNHLAYSDNTDANVAVGPGAASGAAFGYKLRVRGRDDALNAADGEGNWLSIPAWVVLVRPEVRLESGDYAVSVTGWNQIRLASAPYANTAFTANHKIAYSTTGTGDWRYVVDANGNVVNGNNNAYHANRVLVNVNTASPDYEQFKLEYDAWTPDNGETVHNAIFPFTDGAADDAAMQGNVATWTGAEYNGTYYFVDARVPNGILLDEPFYTDDGHRRNGALEPRLTSWLARFPNLSSNDQDGDGLPNGIEYYFWYYASRLAWASVYTDGEHTQVNRALWPAVDLRNRTANNRGEAFTIGRRYNNGYDPDDATRSSYNDANGDHGRGNFWTVLEAADVIDLFNPLVAGDRNADSDNDGLSNVEEIAAGTNPLDCDTDNDWMVDGWEVAFGLDPLNLNPQHGTPDNNDAQLNPDNDFFAIALLTPYSDYHHLFKVSTVSNGADVTNLYYDYEAGTFHRVLRPTMQEIDLTSLTTENLTVANDVDIDDVTAWANEPAIFVEVPQVPVRVRDFAVYQALGFNPLTGWFDGKRPIIPDTEKFGNLDAVNTAAFINLEEFNSAVKRAGGLPIDGNNGNNVIALSSDPQKADTNDDGIPDGWAAYVGMRPYQVPNIPQDGTRDWDADGLTAAEEFQCRVANLLAAAAPNGLGFPDSLINARYDLVQGGWANKILPIDPWNADTDLDGIFDGSEGSASYLYGTPTDASWVGGGCNPNSMDTDGDGMPDGWEYRYGLASTLGTTMPEEDANLDPDEQPNYETADGTYVIPTGAPDPTTASDWGRDYDQDGLPNYQEYLTGILRHLRYDLGPDAARLYKDIPGILQAAGEGAGMAYMWKQIPDVYNILEDLANPSSVPSVDYYMDAAEERVMVHPLLQAIASGHMDAATIGNPAGDLEASQAEYLKPAIVAAFNRIWNVSIFFPTEAQTANYALNPLPATLMSANDGDGTIGYSRQYLTYLAIQNLQRAIGELDVAYQRLQAGLGDNPLLLNSAYAGDTARSQRQVLALIWRIDQLIERLTDGEAATDQAVLKEILTGQGKTLWEARKAQILAYMADALDIDEDPAYTAMADETPAYSGTSGLTFDGETDASAYEETLYTALSDADTPLNPLLASQYRAAIRGYNGGVWVEGNGTYLANIGYHLPLQPFGDLRKEILALGAPVQDVRTLGTYLPQVSTLRDFFMTTSPLVADTDADGLDDYWEVFHGFNPLLGDYANSSSSAGTDTTGRGSFVIDKVGVIYTLGNTDGSGGAFRSFDSAVVQLPSPTGVNSFNNPALELGSVTGYDYYSYPWLAGVPFADPDGDGLTNVEESVNPTGAVPRYGTDPSPLWMTDPDNANSFVTRFYTRLNANITTPVVLEGALGGGETTVFPTLYMPTTGFDYVVRIIPASVPAGSTASVLPYEINEGFDTDGDGISDRVELVSTTSARGDPQTLRTPDRQQAAYFGGAGVMQSHADTQFGPTSLETFTIECWVNPDADQTSDTVILVDRPWRFNALGDTLGAIRHNFRLGLKVKKDGTFAPFASYTGMGTSAPGSADTPAGEPTVTAGATIKAGEWNHLAASYDGSRLAIYINGTEIAALASGLIPANGVITVKNDLSGGVQRYTYRQAPILVGAGPTTAAWIPDWDPELGDFDLEQGFDDIYANAYKGFIDEVRIWNGARSAAQISSNRSKTFTQADLLEQRYNAFLARYSGGGHYASNVPAELVAMYTFNDLLSGSTREEGDEGTLVAEDTPWETYPGEKLIGGDTTPGSFLYRRKGLQETLAAPGTPLINAHTMPTAEEIYTSYYALTMPEKLLSTKYTEAEYVPMAHSTVSHLPVADVERAYSNLLVPLSSDAGEPRLRAPSGNVRNLKAADSEYWTPYAAGTNVSATPTYNVKTEGNPYGYAYFAAARFDQPAYRVRGAYSTWVAPDLMLYGDAFAKYSTNGWWTGPSTDPSGAEEDDEKPGTGEGEGMGWFEHTGDAADNLADQEYSEGGKWLQDHVSGGSTVDSDGDLMPNWWESYYGLDPNDPEGDNGPHGDPDGDFLTNYAEYLASSDPGMYSTAGNGIPDYQIPIWARRGRPTFGLLYTDNDFMEDHWEAANRSEYLSVDVHDAEKDPDGDGWSNWAEVRANFRTGNHSTNPNYRESISQAGNLAPEHPTPALRLTIDFFGNQDVYTNATEGAQLVVHSYTATNNNSAPDATFFLPLATSASEAAQGATLSQEIGNWRFGTLSGYLHMGNIVPGSLKFTFQRYTNNTATETESGSSTNQEYVFWEVLADTVTSGDVARLYTKQYLYIPTVDEATGAVSYTTTEEEIDLGTVNYRTGYYEMIFATDDSFWSDGEFVYQNPDTGVLERYAQDEFLGTASYRYTISPGQSNTFTLVRPDSGWLREGINNFYVFADLDGDGRWDNGEPGGTPDQHDVDIGFDQVNRTLHVALTEKAPPGSVRFDVGSIITTLQAEAGQITDEEGTPSSTIPNESTGTNLNPTYFTGLNDGSTFLLALTPYKVFGHSDGDDGTTVLEANPVFKKEYNLKKPYLTEDEIFAANPAGLPCMGGTTTVKASYKVYLVPIELQNYQRDRWQNYNIGVVTNYVDAIDAESTAIVAPVGGDVRSNTELTFEWKSNVQVPTFNLTITKVEDALGNPVSEVVFDKTIRGVTASATDLGTGGKEQFRYRYVLSRGIGELNESNALFGNGLYDYTLTLNPYNGDSRTLSSSFRIQLRDSGKDGGLAEYQDADKSVSFTGQDSYYVRAHVRYNGVLMTTDDFGGGRLVVEAHRSGSFNGDPIAANSDLLVYDAEDEEAAGFNRTITMNKDSVYKRTYTDGQTEFDAFFSTRFDVEVRGLPTNEPVYLMAYLDLNRNGKRDAWEPWGYAAQGLESTTGYYFDPASAAPVNGGVDYQFDFYIQDVDTDNDKLADAWEWKQSKALGTDVSKDFGDWCNNFKGSTTDHIGTSIWTVDAQGKLALTAYGAQLYGLTVTEVNADGSVKTAELPENLEEAREIIDILGYETAIKLYKDGYDTYGLTVTGINLVDGQVTLTWDVAAATKTDGTVANLTDFFSGAMSSSAIYAVYGKADLGDAAWTKLGEISVTGTQSPNATLDAATLTIDGKPAQFFKVILSSKKAAKTLAD